MRIMESNLPLHTFLFLSSPIIFLEREKKEINTVVKTLENLMPLKKCPLFSKMQQQNLEIDKFIL